MKQVTFRHSLDPAFVGRALGLPLPAKPDLPAYTTVVSDSRKVTPGSLFVALSGDQFDGHDFIEKAIASGATGIICRKEKASAVPAPVRAYPVDDTVTAYRKLAAAWRREFHIPIFGIGGSAGKTTTKELLFSILHGKFERVLKTVGSQNGFVGIPMTLLELRTEHQAAVVEIGIDEIGAMEQHAPLVAPTAALLTSIGPEHLEKLRDVPTVAQEEGMLLSFVSQAGGIVAINTDDPWIRPHLKVLRTGTRVQYGLEKPAFGDADETLWGVINEEGTRMRVSGQGLQETDLPLPLLGRHNALNLLGAVALARSAGLTADEIQRGLATFKGAEGRSELRELPGPTPILCDYYNAQPLSVEAGLDLLTQIASKGSKKRARWACLADMLELGPDEEKFHRELAGKIVHLSIEHVHLYGPRMKALREELKDRAFAGSVEHHESHESLARAVITGARPGDALMIKGSRGMRMEEVWKTLEKEFGK